MRAFASSQDIGQELNAAAEPLVDVPHLAVAALASVIKFAHEKKSMTSSPKDESTQARTTDIPALIRDETNRIIASSYQHGAFSPWHINTGWCAELARNVSNKLSQAGIDNKILDSFWLIRRGPNEGRPKGVGLLGYHEFLYADGRYYDSEVPEGVSSPYELPIVKAATVSRADEQKVMAFLDDINHPGAFPCPQPIKDAFVSTLRAFSQQLRDADDRDYKAAHVATQTLLEPVKASMLHDAHILANTLERIFRSFGLDCEVESGNAPPCFELDEEHSWVRFANGTILDGCIEGTSQYQSSIIGGRVRLVHANDPLNQEYKPRELTWAMK